MCYILVSYRRFPSAQFTLDLLTIDRFQNGLVGRWALKSGFLVSALA